MKNTLSLLFAVLLPILLFAQNSVQGTIKDENGNPIDAAVYLPQLEKGTMSDLDGNFIIKNIPNGTYTIVATSLGYESQSQKVEFTGTTEATIYFQLRPSVVEMEEVIVSTPFHKLQSENVMKVERISVNELQKNGAVNLSQGISAIAGVSTISTGNAIGKPVIRGLSSNRVLTYAQGVRLENQQFGEEHGLGINGAGIGSVEVIKGPATLLYGSDALGGVLYLNPESFALSGTTDVLLNSGYYSNGNGFQASGAVKSSGEHFKFLARGTRNSFADYTTGEGMDVTNSRSNEYDFKTGVQYQRERWKSTLRYNLNSSEIGIPEEIYTPPTDRSPLLPFQELNNHILSWENAVFFDNSSLDIKLGYLFNDRKEFEESFDEAELHMKLSTFNYNVQYHLPKMKSFETIIGIQGMFQTNRNEGEELLIPDADKVDFGIFATTHYHLERWGFQGGLRYDMRNITTTAHGDPEELEYMPAIDRSFSSFNAALGAKYDLAKKWTIRLNIASGFRAPNLSELASNGIHEGTNRYEIGNPDLNNEQNLQTDMVLEYRSEHLEFYVNGFYNGIADYIFIRPTGDILEGEAVFVYEQFDSRLYGGEVGFHWHPHPWDWLHWESSFETVTGKLKDGGYLPLIPANTWTNTLRFEWSKWGVLKNPNGFITLRNVFDQDNPSTFETTTQGYALLSLGLGSSVAFGKTELTWGINMTNALDENYIDHLSRLKGDGIANMGRSLNVNLNLEL